MSLKETPEMIELLRAAYDYDAATGHVTHRARSGVIAGARAGTLKDDGYRIVHFKGRRFQEHRLIFALMTGRWPAHQIDHENTIRDDNRWTNLREATPTQNNANVCSRALKGVDFHKYRNQWRARIRLNGKRHDLGHFETAEEASAVYTAAFKAAHGEFARTEPAYLD
ncbi:HNH endonuclease [Bradyrhizobium stylosanthis]|uniref:AP2 domain-containing protein n=1 Tax=Bradyrhizobium stylosanthis TaxID=1803665 RepID=A0A560CXI3_9BRAD|nr:HNH endonuclease [Bradyrhizobium stylosanthis]TWA89567.1 AP2 domain-containing protein [Bradyrhizobium stylosanthis]